MEIAVGALIAIIAGIVATVGAKAIEMWWRSRVTVKRITDLKKDKKTINQLINLYEEIFPDGFHADELYELIQIGLQGSNERPVEVQDSWLVAKNRGTVVGFFFCNYYPKRKKAWVSYYGVKKPRELPEDAVSTKLLDEILAHLREQECEYLFFDVHRSNKGLKRLFKKDAKIYEVDAFAMKFDYKAPKISSTHARSQPALTLMVIPLKKSSLKVPIDRATFSDFLNFVYFDCYGDIYTITDIRFEKFQKYLAAKFKETTKEIPEWVEVE